MLFNGKNIFCNDCGSFDMKIIEDELIAGINGSSVKEVIKCNRCNSYFTKEFIEANIELFTLQEEMNKIVERRKALSEHYKDLDEQNKGISIWKK